MSAARQTRVGSTCGPPGLNNYAEQPCTENARFCRWSRGMEAVAEVSNGVGTSS